MRQITNYATAIALVAAACTVASAQTAGMMSFQALLRDANGTPVDGPVTVSFTIVDSGGTLVAGPFAASGTANAGVISVKYGPVAPSAFNGAARYLRANVTAPALGVLNDVEIVTPPAIAEQVNALGTGNSALLTSANGNVGIGGVPSSRRLDVYGDIGTRSILTGIWSTRTYSDTFGGRFDALEDHPDANARAVVGLASPRSGVVRVNDANNRGVTITPFGISCYRNLVSDESIRLQTLDGRIICDQVGIGTQNPLTTLHVRTAGFPAGEVRFSKSGGDQILRLDPDGGGTNQSIILERLSTDILALTSFFDAYRLVATGNKSMLFGTNNRANDLSISGAGNITLGNSGRVGIGRVAEVNKLEVEGNASKTTAGDWLANSDRRIKTDIDGIENALESLDRIRVTSFRYTDEYRAAHPSIEDRRYLNVIAQEFADVFPDHVSGSGEKLADGSQILQVDTWPLTIFSVAGVQELHAKHQAEAREWRAAMAEKEQRISELSERMTKLERLVEHFAAKESAE